MADMSLNKRDRIFYFKRYEKGKVVSKYQTRKLRRFSYSLQAVEFSELTDKVYIKVGYHKKGTLGGKHLKFYNDGYYTDKEELLKAYKAFIEWYKKALNKSKDKRNIVPGNLWGLSYII